MNENFLPSECVGWLIKDIGAIRAAIHKVFENEVNEIPTLSDSPSPAEFVEWLWDCAERSKGRHATTSSRLGWLAAIGIIWFKRALYISSDNKTDDLLNELIMTLKAHQDGIDDDLTDILRI